ncbi:MAG: hypothetical protein A2255_04630 [Candidatus Melainabacteria bacterium RIFOXYA2_FULL_32_9]|nr:MAG: hypothetical protein A2255_04630 [Candidatus Melainabacteria bacterium RIFOXYA2_FULL_32_9]
MNIQSNYNLGYTVKKPEKREISFKATLPEIKEAVNKAVEEKKMCPGKASFFNKLVDFFEKTQEQMKKNPNIQEKFDFELGQKNEFSEEVRKIKIDNTTLEDIDNNFNGTSFSCGSDEGCTCGKGQSLGQFIKTYFEETLNLNKADTIEINK